MWDGLRHLERILVYMDDSVELLDWRAGGMQSQRHYIYRSHRVGKPAGFYRENTVVVLYG